MAGGRLGPHHPTKTGEKKHTQNLYFIQTIPVFINKSLCLHLNKITSDLFWNKNLSRTKVGDVALPYRSVWQPFITYPLEQL